MTKFLKALSLLWVLVILGCTVFTYMHLQTPGQLQFNLLTLLPDTKDADTQPIQEYLIESNANNRFLVLFGSQDQNHAKATLLELIDTFKSSNTPLQIDLYDSSAYTTFFSQLYPYRGGILSLRDRSKLVEDQYGAFTKRALTAVSSPFSMPAQIETDPFGLFLDFVQSLHNAFSFSRDSEGFPYVKREGIYWYIFQGILTDSAFSLKNQEKIINQIETLPRPSDVNILKWGALFYASAGAQHAQSEITFMGSLSVALIILFILLIFRSLRPLLFASITIATGFIGGLTTISLTFDSVHILSLVFGLSLMGIAVDYAIHYYSAGITSQNPFEKLIPALPLGVLSSVCGYGLLILLPFPGIKQMALLTAVGLIFSFITVCLWGHYFLPKHTPNALVSLCEWLENYLLRIRFVGTRIFSTLLLAALFFAGFPFISFQDNVKSFQSLDSDLMTEEEHIKNLLTLPNSSSFFLIEGDSQEDRLEIEEGLIEALHAHGIDRVSGLSIIFPSLRRQKQNYQLVRNLYTDQGPILQKLLGWADPIIHFDRELQSSYLSSNERNKISLPAPWASLQTTSFQHLLIGEDVHTELLQTLAGQFEGVRYINPPQLYSSIFQTYREILTLSLVIVLVLITCLLSIKFTVREGLKLVLPVILSTLGGVGCLSLVGEPITLFTVMGFLLVICIGVDYALFLHRQTVLTLPLLANFMAAFTTLVSFGLLALSHTMAVHSFGMAVFIGITLTLVTTTLFAGDEYGK